MGFYATPAHRTVIESVRLAADLPPAQRPAVQVLRTDSPTFAALIEAQRNRHDAFYTVPAGHIDLCSIDIPARAIHATDGARP
jgi:peptidylprolyl isomerase